MLLYYTTAQHSSSSSSYSMSIPPTAVGSTCSLSSMIFQRKCTRSSSVTLGMIISMKILGDIGPQVQLPPSVIPPSHPTRRKYIMQALSSVSLKRKRQDAEAPSSSSTKRPGIAATPGNPDWPCLDTVHCPDGRLKIVQKKDGNQFVVSYYTAAHSSSTSSQ